MTEKLSETFLFHLTPTDKKLLKFMAERERRSMGDYLRYLIWHDANLEDPDFVERLNAG